MIIMNNIEIAELLIKNHIININFDQPFKFTSGKQSPVYVNIRKLLAFPKERKQLINELILRLNNSYFDIIAGGETAGIPFASFIATELDLPMSYVRKKPKEFGLNNQIEGASVEQKTVLLVEDLMTDGGSKINFTNAIRNSNGILNYIAVIFYYNIFEESKIFLEEEKLNLIYLCSWLDIYQYLKDINDENALFLRDLILSPNDYIK